MKAEIKRVIRSLRTGAWPATFAVLALCVRISINGALFAFVYAAFLRPLPFQRADQLCFLSETNPPPDLPMGPLCPRITGISARHKDFSRPCRRDTLGSGPALR